MPKGKKTEDKTCTKLESGELGARMETHNNPFHLQQVYYIQWQNEVEQQFLGERAWTL
jgi:hypothetical protein